MLKKLKATLCEMLAVDAAPRNGSPLHRVHYPSDLRGRFVSRLHFHATCCFVLLLPDVLFHIQLTQALQVYLKNL